MTKICREQSGIPGELGCSNTLRAQFFLRQPCLNPVLIHLHSDVEQQRFLPSRLAAYSARSAALYSSGKVRPSLGEQARPMETVIRFSCVLFSFIWDMADSSS